MFHLNACMDTSEKDFPPYQQEKNPIVRQIRSPIAQPDKKKTELNLQHDFNKHRAK